MSTPEDLMKLARPTPALSTDLCELCMGLYDAHVVEVLLRKADEETGLIAKQLFEKAMLVRFGRFCLTCACRAADAGKTVEITTGAK